MSFDPEIAAIRFGYGLSPHIAPPQSPQAMLEALAAPDEMARAYPIPGVAALAESFAQAREINRARRAGAPGAREALRDWRQANRERHAAMLRATVARGVAAPDALRERLTRFWADHFTVKGRGTTRLVVQSFVEDAIRPHVSAPFATMLRAAETHPLMLIYLDQASSIGPGSEVAARNAKKGRRRGMNENLARELLELHTLGVGGAYGQDDVRQLAELLAGLTVRRTSEGVFLPERGEPGAEQVLGRSYGGPRPKLEDIHAALGDIAVHPDTAAHIARKLAVHFVSDSPPEGLVRHLRDAFVETAGDLGAVTRALLEHPAAWGPLEKTKQPFDFIVSAGRALGLSGARVAGLDLQQTRRVLERPMALMGQKWEDPTGPDGWPEDSAHWLTPQGLAVRINWAMAAGRLRDIELPDPRALVRNALGGQAGPGLRFAARAAERQAEGVGIVLSSPDFQKR